eukprot:7829980-Alexandrium_andersonii.AAC.1
MPRRGPTHRAPAGSPQRTSAPRSTGPTRPPVPRITWPPWESTQPTGPAQCHARTSHGCSGCAGQSTPSPR